MPVSPENHARVLALMEEIKQTEEGSAWLIAYLQGRLDELKRSR